MTITQHTPKIFPCPALLLLLILCMPAHSEIVLAPMESARGQSTVTRDVAEYTEREQALIAQVLAKDDATPSLLADDFEAWSNSKNDWQTKAEWLASEQSGQSFVINNVSVRMFGDLAVVQFLLQIKSHKGAHPSYKFIVDIWRQSTKQLSARYTTDAADFHNIGQFSNKHQ